MNIFIQMTNYAKDIFTSAQNKKNDAVEGNFYT